MKGVYLAAIAAVAVLGLYVGCGNKARSAPSGAADGAKAVTEPGLARPQGVWDGAVDTGWYNGSDTEFVIATAAQFAGFARIVNGGRDFRGKTVRLGANIMLNDTTEWRSWGADSLPYNDNWEPIGVDDHRFDGTFDGGGFAVSGIYIDNPIEDNSGLFGVVDYNGIIRGLGIVASYIKGGDYVGALAGTNSGRIIGCYSTGMAVGDSVVGGLVGVNDGAISNCYTAGSVAGGGTVGGFIGVNRMGVVSAGYSTAAVSGDSVVGGFVGVNFGVMRGNFSVGVVEGRADAGGFAGRNVGSAIWGNYYDGEVSEQCGGLGRGSGKAEGKTTARMQSKDFVDTLNVTAGILSINAWVYSEGKYPVLGGQIADAVDIGRYFAKGDGTPNDPYMINAREQLEEFSILVNIGARFSDKHIRLGANIALNDTAKWQDWTAHPPANVWRPIGIPVHPFVGIFDGGGFAVSGVYVNDERAYFQGLFGIMGRGGLIKNLGVTASHIRGGSMVGGLVGGNNDGIVIHSYSMAHVTGAEWGVGGLVGNNYGGEVRGSYATGRVHGKAHVGGLVGANGGGEIRDSYATGAVAAEGTSVGGLVGTNDTRGTVSNCFSVGSVTGSTHGYALLGSNHGKVRDSYYNNQTSPAPKVPAATPKDTAAASKDATAAQKSAVAAPKDTAATQNLDLSHGKTTWEMRRRATFAGWDLEKVWGLDGWTNAGYPYLRENKVKTKPPPPPPPQPPPQP